MRLFCKVSYARLKLFKIVLLCSAFMLLCGGWRVSAADATSCATCPSGPANGNIHPNVIEIDGQSGAGDDPAHQAANLFPVNGSDTTCKVNSLVKNSNATVDWVKDCTTTYTQAALCNSVALGIAPLGSGAFTNGCTGGIPTGVAGGKGSWYGVRLVDGSDGQDQDIFIKGGKENSPEEWQVGPGSIGSSKYDFTQGYLANNNTTLFAAFERRGNNGTTAFDLEFNKIAPHVNPLNASVPTRTAGDILLTFEAQGSGSSGSVTVHCFVWNAATNHYDEQDISNVAGILTSLNNNTTTKSEPWGHVNSQGNWTLENLERFTLAEVCVPLSLLGVNGSACNISRFVQIRTRSSSTDTSDLKDATHIFPFSFGGPVARGSVTPGNCNQTFAFDASTSTNSAQGTTGLTYCWSFSTDKGTLTTGTCPGSSNTLTASTATGTVKVCGVPSGEVATITAAIKVVENGTCSDTTACNNTQSGIIAEVNGPTPAPSACLKAKCDGTFDFSGGNSSGSFTNLWTFTVQSGVVLSGGGVSSCGANCYSTTQASGTVTISNFGGNNPAGISALLVVTGMDTNCTASGSQNTSVPVPLSVNATKQAPVAPDSDKTGDADFTLRINGSTNAPVAETISYQWQYNSGTSANPVWTNLQGETTLNLTLSLTQIQGLALGAVGTDANFSIGTDNYVGRVWAAQVRLHAERTLTTVDANCNATTVTCSANSAVANVKVAKGVDP
jgi:hypothetical protein